MIIFITSIFFFYYTAFLLRYLLYLWSQFIFIMSYYMSYYMFICLIIIFIIISISRLLKSYIVIFIIISFTNISLLVTTG